MSVMQVVGSSRISNTTYLAVASIYWTLFLTVSNIALNLDIQTSILIITPSAGIAAFLWVLNLEEAFVMGILLRALPRTFSGRQIRYNIGYSTIHLQTWKTALDNLPETQSSLREEVKRILRSPLLKNEVEMFYQLFWLLVSVPALFFLLGLSLQVTAFEALSLLGASILIDIILLLLTIIRKREWPMRILGLAYCHWFTETLESMDRRRESFVSRENMWFPLKNPEFFPEREKSTKRFIIKSKPWFGELIAMANREDWDGFEKNLYGFLKSQDIIYQQEGTEELWDSLVKDILWSFKRERIMGPYPEGITISFEMAHPLGHRWRTKSALLDAFAEIEKLDSPLPSTDWKNDLRNFLSQWDKLVSWDAVYGIITEKMMKTIQSATRRAFAEMPFFQENPNADVEGQCQFGSEKAELLDIVLCLHKAVDQNLIAPDIAFKASVEWRIMPRHYMEKCSARIRPLILEIESALPANEIKQVVQRVVQDSPNLDPAKAAANLERYKDEPNFGEIIHEIRIAMGSKPDRRRAIIAKAILSALGAYESTNG